MKSEVGKTIQVYGRQLFVYDCDDATKEFYEKSDGWELASC